MLFLTHARRLTLGACLLAALTPLAARAEHARHARHVVLVSVDGLHQSDLEWFVATHPGSTLAALVRGGVSYSNVRTPFPSDSFPGLVAQVTGGNPRTTGVYYDDSWNRALLAPGTTDCTNGSPGTEVTYFEALDLNPLAIDAGFGVGAIDSAANIVKHIYKLPAQARELIDPAQLPVDPTTCAVVYPHAYLRVNTVFEVAKAHGLHTAWSDKHAAYDIINGPSGAGVDDLFVPEINSSLPADLGSSGDDFTKDNANTQFYDSLKVTAVLRWAAGRNHDGSSNTAGAPAIYGMNFQSVSTAQKLNFSHLAGEPGVTALGGYASAGTIPGPVVMSALEFVDASLGRIKAAIDARDTVLIVSAKHGQSPLDRSQLTLIDDGAVTGALNDAWAARHPASTQPLVAFSINDDGMLLWLSDRTPPAIRFARDFLMNYTAYAIGSDASGALTVKSAPSSGLREIRAGAEAREFIGVGPSDERVPDIIGIATIGTVYSSTAKIKKIAEHGGNAPADRHVPLLVWGAGIGRGSSAERVETTQIAPTILALLGLPSDELEAVRREGTEVLPELRR